ncbi:unnamed protein product [Caenorhabditis auriculariae]|uniref:Mos1 transposase HTH domain-containing protein n=1 Tax=Caenorhabditis auriculariae TaxID=2777116 RepID=A0A8S1HW02_9PELO|nr:unnamed protein product [Caenorhabditis auriculariae]
MEARRSNRTFVYNELLLGNDTGIAVANICRACKEDAVSQCTVRRCFNRFENGYRSLESREPSERPYRDDDEFRRCPPSRIDSTYPATTKFCPVGSRPSDERQQAEPNGAVCQFLLFVRIARSFSRTWSRRWELGPLRQRRPPCCLDPARRRAADNAESRPAPAEDHALLLVDAKGMLYFELLPQGRMVTASTYTDQLEELAGGIGEKRPRRALVYLLPDNARPHVEKETQQKLATLGCETVSGPRPLRLQLVPSARAPFGRKKIH